LAPISAFIGVFNNRGDFLRARAVIKPKIKVEYLALILTERLMARSRDTDFADLDSVTQCAATFSYAAALTRLREYPTIVLDEVERRWTHVHRNGSRKDTQSFTQALLGFWNLVELFDEEQIPHTPIGNILGAANAYINNGEVDDYYWPAISREIPEVRTLALQIRGVKEQQVEPLRRVISLLANAEHIPRLDREFMVGLLFAEFANNSLTYLSVALIYCRQIPLGVFWFTLLSASSGNSDILSFGNSIGRFVKKQLEADFLSSLPPDIVFDEMLTGETVSRRARARQLSGNEMTVGLLDGVITRVRDLQQEARVPLESEQSSRKLTEEMHNLSRAARSLISKLDATIAATSTVGQLQLPTVDEQPKRAPKKKT
jgi:hypothetical protein